MFKKIIEFFFRYDLNAGQVLPKGFRYGIFTTGEGTPVPYWSLILPIPFSDNYLEDVTIRRLRVHLYCFFWIVAVGQPVQRGFMPVVDYRHEPLYRSTV